MVHTQHVRDVIPGDPQRILEQSNVYLRLEESLNECSVRLEHLVSQTTSRSVFIKAVTEKMHELRNVIMRASLRAQGPRQALHSFGSTLQQLQQRAQQVLQQQEDARQRVNHNINQYNQVGDTLSRMAADTVQQSSPLINQLNALRSTIARGREHLNGLQGSLNGIQREYDEAVNQAVGTIRKLQEESKLKDTFMTKVQSTILHVGKVMTDTVSVLVKPFEWLADSFTEYFSGCANMASNIKGFFDDIGLSIVGKPFGIVESVFKGLKVVPGLLTAPIRGVRDVLQLVNGDQSLRSFTKNLARGSIDLIGNTFELLKHGGSVANKLIGGKIGKIGKIVNKVVSLPDKIYGPVSHFFGWKSHTISEAAHEGMNAVLGIFDSNIKLSNPRKPAHTPQPDRLIDYVPNLHNRYDPVIG